MIQIKTMRRGKNVTLSVTGHAGAAKSGSDVVCAAVSILVITLWQALEKSKHRLRESTLRHGEARLSFKLCHATVPLLETVMCGFRFLADTYPQYVEIKQQL